MLIDIIDAVREPLLVLDPDFRVTHANRAFFRAFRVDARDTIGEVLFTIGDGQWDIPPLRELLRELVGELLGTTVGAAPQLRDVDVDHVFPRIGRKTMLLNATLVSRGPDEARIILLAIEDVTEQRAAERRLAEQRRELERSNAALEEFASIASHDLQEPLRKILAFGERLETVGRARPARRGPQPSGPDARRRRSHAHADQRSPDVLAGHGAQPALRADGSCRAQRTKSSPISRWSSPTRLAAWRSASCRSSTPTRFKCGNCSRTWSPTRSSIATPDRPPVVRISSSSPDAAHCTIAVADNGIGFNPEYTERIFKMFERLHGRARYDGSGIGLAICRRIAERHGGTITATSSPGQGATFTVTLPLTHAARGPLS